jgi:hypothetical protein
LSLWQIASCFFPWIPAETWPLDKIAMLASACARLPDGTGLQLSEELLFPYASDPKHLGAEIGVIAILHTWGQNLLLHPTIHCVIPAGGFSPDHRRWIRPRYAFILPVKVLSRVFRGKFLGFSFPTFGNMPMATSMPRVRIWVTTLFRLCEAV